MGRSKLRGDDLVKAAGGLVWRAGRRGPELAVIRRAKRGDWSLPKGKLEDGEAFTAAAVREVAEETGCRARLGEFAGYNLYDVKGRPKLVLFWHMAVERECAFRPNREADRLEWLPPKEAAARLHHPEERRLVRSVLAGDGAPALRE